jgi:hypothetical protein
MSVLIYTCEPPPCDQCKYIRLNEFTFSVNVEDINPNLHKQFVIFPEHIKKLFKLAGASIENKSVTKLNQMNGIPKEFSQPSIPYLHAVSQICAEIGTKHLALLSLSELCGYETATEYIVCTSNILIISRKYDNVMCMSLKNTKEYLFLSPTFIRFYSDKLECYGKVSDGVDGCTISARSICTSPKFTQTMRSNVSNTNEFTMKGRVCQLNYNYIGDGVQLCNQTVLTQNLVGHTKVTHYVKNGNLHSHEKEVYDMIDEEFSRETTTSCEFTNSSTGLRQRGTYNKVEKDGAKETKHCIDGKTVRHEKDGNIVIDTISEERDKAKEYIGWKICKNDKNEYRIVKLRIPTEAEFLMAIDDEYFSCYRKHRSNFAIVEDIQLPLQYEEQSVSDAEPEVYSYVYENCKTAYKIGEMVRSDKYDTDITSGCAKGIHWYKERKYAFQHIPEFKNTIACKYD